MPIIIDVVFIALFVLSLVRHYRLGLACSVLSAGKFVFALLAAAVLRTPTASLILMFWDGSSLSAQGESIVSGVLAFILVFVAVFILSGFIIRMLSKIKIPVITRIDKLLGLLLGAIIGILSVSALATVVYSVLEIITFIDPESVALTIYDDSYVFRFVYGLRIFEFIRNLI